MDLILWRHAEAEDGDGMDDLNRALTPRGEKHAARMAQWLDRHLPEGTRILCSPARRCEQTAMALGRKYKVRGELAPDGTVEQLLQLVQWPRAKLPVLVVGHQPVLGQAVGHILEWPSGGSVRKGAVWWLRGRERAGHSQSLIYTVQTPDFL